MTFVLRAARSTDAGQMGEILHRFEVETPWMPKEHSCAEAISFCGVMIDRGWVTVAVCDRRVLGFLARDGSEICSLYVTQHAQGQGVGAALVDDAKTQLDHLSLWTCQDNIAAQRFYQRQRFVEVARTDGAQSPEQLPDVSYVWRRDLNASSSGNTCYEKECAQ